MALGRQKHGEKPSTCRFQASRVPTLLGLRQCPCRWDREGQGLLLEHQPCSRLYLHGDHEEQGPQSLCLGRG